MNIGDEQTQGSTFSQRLERARRGSAEALGKVLDPCRQYLLLIANRRFDKRLRGQESPSDVVQDTYVAAQQRINGFTGSDKRQLLAWLRRILLNKLANLHRRSHKLQTGDRPRTVSLEQVESLSSAPAVTRAAPSPSEVAVSRERRDALYRALARLKDGYREVIRLRTFEQRTFVEIGRLMGRSEGDVQKLWLRAIRKLAKDPEVFQ